MSQSVDQRVVEMRFDNKQFESGVKESLGTLDKLKNILDKGISSKSIDDIGKAAKNTDMSSLVNGVQSLADRFSTLGIVGMRVIENITDGLMNGLTKGIHAATDAIVSGGIKRAMNIENAHFQLQGLINDEREVQAVMDDAMDSVDGTAYAYDEAAKAASMFAASGLKSGDQMQTALRGIAGVAATTNQEYQRVADVFTKIAGKGKIQGEELNQFASMGMNAAAAMTKYFNEVNDGTIQVDENFKKLVTDLTDGAQITEAELRDMASKGAVSFELFSKAMGDSFGEHAKDANKTFTGSMSNIRAALARTGAMFVSPLVKQDGPFVQFFNAIRVKVNEFNKALGATNGIAERFTTWVNSIVTKMTGVVENFKVANTWVQKFGDGATKTFADAHHTIQKFGDGTQRVISGEVYTPFSAFEDIIYTIINSVKALGSVLKPVGQAFKEVFGGSMGSNDIYKFIENLRNLSEGLKLSEKNSENLKKGFTGIFKVTQSIVNLFVRLVKATGLFSNSTTKLGDSIFDLIGWFGDLLIKFSDFLSSSKMIETVITGIGKALHGLTSLIRIVIGGLTSIGDKFKGGFQIDTSSMDKLKEKISNISFSFEGIKKVFSEVKEKILDVLDPIISKFDTFNKKTEEAKKPAIDFQKAIDNISSALADMIRHIDPIKAFLAILNGTLIAGILTKIKGIFTTLDKGAKKVVNAPTMKTLLGSIQGTINTISASINTLTKSVAKDLDSFSKLIDAKALKEIAISIAILSGALFVLSTIDGEALGNALAAVSAMIVELVGSLVILSKAMSSGGIKNALGGVIDAAKMNALSSVLIKMAAAILILSFAVSTLGQMDIEDLMKGLMGVTILIKEMIVVIFALEKIGGPKKMTAIGFGLMMIATSILILTQGVKQLGALDIQTIVKGLISVGALLVGLGVFTKLVGGETKMMSIGLGMILVSSAVLILSQAMKSLSSLSIEDIAEGLAAIGGVILELAIFTQLTGGSKKMISVSISMVILTAAISKLAMVMQELSYMSWEGIQKGLTGIGASIGILVAAMRLVPKGGMAKSVELIIMVMNAKKLADIIVTLSDISWEGVAKACTALAGSLLIIIGAIAIINKVKFSMDKIMLFSSFVAIIKKPISEILLTLSQMEWEEIGRACTALTGALLVLIGAMALMSKVKGNSLVGIATFAIFVYSIKPIANVLLELSTMEWGGIARACTALAGALLILIGGMYLAGVNAAMAIPGAVAIMLVVTSMKPIASAMLELGTMEWSSIGHACAALASALLILIGAVYLAGINALMAIPGAVAIAIVAQSLIPIADSMQKLGSMEWAGIARAITALAATIGILMGTMLLISAMGPVGLAAVAVLAALALSLAAAAKIMSGAIVSLTEGINGLSDIDHDSFVTKAEIISEALGVLAKGLKAFGISSIAGAISFKSLSDGIAKLAPALEILTKLDPEAIGTSMTHLGESFAAFGPSLKTFGWDSSFGAKAMEKLGSSIALMAPGIKTLSEIPGQTLSSILDTLGKAFKSFGEALDATPFWGSGMRAKGIGSLIDNIGKLTEALPPFIAIPTEQAKTALGTLANAFKGFGDALTATPFWGSSGRGEGIGNLVEVIPQLTEVLPPFINVLTSNGTLVESAFTSLGNGFKVFGDTLNSAPLFNADERATGITELVNSISTLTTGLQEFMTLDSASVATAFTSLGSAFTTFGQSVSTAPLFNADERATGIVTIVESIEALANGIVKIMEINVNDAAVVMEAIGTAFGDFGAALKKSPFWGASDRAGAMSTLVSSVDMLAESIVKLSAIPYQTMVNVIGAIKAAISSFGEALTQYGSTVSMNVGVIDTIAQSATTISNINAAALTSAVDALEKLILVITNLSGVNTSQTSEFANGLMQLANNGLTAFMQAFNEEGTAVHESINTWMLSIIQIFKEKEPQFKTAGIQQINQYLSGIKSRYGEAKKTGQTLGQNVYAGVQEIGKKFPELGRYCVQGFINGLRDSELMKQVRAAAKAMAEEAKQASMDALGEASPSKDYDKIGAYGVLGFVNGLYRFGSAVSTAGADLANTATAGLNKALSGLQDGVDDMLEANPVITPMVDLTNVLSAADQINALFSSALMNTNANVGTISKAVATAQTNSNKNNQNEESSYGNTYNFVQNNTSPKALSRIEIYRDSRNLFRQYREAVEGV